MLSYEGCDGEPWQLLRGISVTLGQLVIWKHSDRVCLMLELIRVILDVHCAIEFLRRYSKGWRGRHVRYMRVGE
jgi:hypothetical protein